MKLVKLQGGLGNQLFQWAFYKSLKNQINDDCLIDISLYKNQVGITHREFSLDKFPNIVYETYDKINKINFTHISDNFNYQKWDLVKNQNYYFDGYWQTEKYFKYIKSEIQHQLSPTKEIKKTLNNIIPDNNKSVSLHVRRTDYLTTNGFHPVQDITYYNKGLEIIGDYDIIYVFSDDIDWCKQNLNYKNAVFIENNDNVTDIWLQSICKNNIIANSSFSWWGAWLNNNTDKKVIAPSRWFGNHANLNTKDIIPEEWIII